ncbi:putative 4-coumarate--CoA ligase 1 isoform X1 [Megalopta genalis]
MKNNPSIVAQVDVTTDEENTSEQLLDRAVRCALWLRKEGVKKGGVIAISMHNHPDCLVPCIAALFIGVIFNPWDPGMNTNLARHFMRLTEPRVVFANERSTGVMLDAARIEGFELKVVTFGDYVGTLSFADVLEGHPRSAVTSFRCENVELGDTAQILVSSGTTGLSKGVELSHRMILLNLVDNAAVHLTVMATPLWFSTLCWISGILCNLKIFSTSARKIIGPDFEPQKVCELVEKYKGLRSLGYPHLAIFLYPGMDVDGQ